MEDREDGGMHTGEVTVHTPFSLSTSYFDVQVNADSIPYIMS